MKVALVCSDDFSLWVFRKGLISTLIEQGHSIYLICSPGKYINLLEEMGAIHIPVDLYRFFNPLKDIKLFLNFYRIFRRENFDIVHSFTIKPNIFGAVAAKIAGVKKIILSVTGAGIIKEDEFTRGLKMKVLRAILKKLYWLACTISNKVWVQNADDIDFFKKKRILREGKAVLIRSSGVNLDEFSPKAVDQRALYHIKRELDSNISTKFVLMVTRPLWNKGVREFIDASEIIGGKYPFIKFILVGGIDEGNPLSVAEDFLREKESNNFKWLGFRDEIRELLMISDVSVLPSYYPEGIPKNLLEALAMRKPIVTTNNVGCKEVVEESKNGYLVPIKDSKALADAIEKLIIDGNKREEFGRYSRMKAEKEFDEKLIVNRILNELYQLNL